MCIFKSQVIKWDHPYFLLQSSTSSRTLKVIALDSLPLSSPSPALIPSDFNIPTDDRPKALASQFLSSPPEILPSTLTRLLTPRVIFQPCHSRPLLYTNLHYPPQSTLCPPTLLLPPPPPPFFHLSFTGSSTGLKNPSLLLPFRARAPCSPLFTQFKCHGLCQLKVASSAWATRLSETGENTQDSREGKWVSLMILAGRTTQELGAA